MQATFTATLTECDPITCYWYPVATEAAADDFCDPTSTDFIYVGDHRESPGTVTDTERFIPAHQPEKICLFISKGVSMKPVSETLYRPPIHLTIRARRRQPLKPFGRGRYDNLATNLRCNQPCSGRLRALPFYRSRGHRTALRGLDLAEDFKLAGRETTPYGFDFTRHERHRLNRVMRRHGSILWSFRFTATAKDGTSDTARKRIWMLPEKKRRPKLPHRRSCDPSYPTVCIPPFPPDLDCGDVSERNFAVRGSDPHGFDNDGDGVGCET